MSELKGQLEITRDELAKEVREVTVLLTERDVVFAAYAMELWRAFYELLDAGYDYDRILLAWGMFFRAAEQVLEALKDEAYTRFYRLVELGTSYVVQLLRRAFYEEFRKECEG